MTDAVAATRARIAELAAEQGIPVEQDAHGDFTVPFGSTMAFAQVSTDPDGRAVIDVWAPVATDVSITADLHRFAAERSFLFGRLVVEATGDGVGQVVLTHTLLGEPLTGDVVLQVLGAVAGTADDLDDEVVSRFGGRRFDGTGPPAV